MKLPKSFEFIEGDHTYLVNDKVVPSVTQVLTDLGFIDLRYYTKEGRDRGTDVHDVLAMISMGLDVDVPEELTGYIESFYLWRDFFNVDISAEHVEEHVYSSKWGFAGTVDLGKATINRSRYIIDYKTGAAADWHALQLTAYASCYPTRPKALSVYLQKSGKVAKVIDQDVSQRSINDFDWAAIMRTYQRKHS